MVDIESSIPVEQMRRILDVSRQLAITSDLDRLLPVICRAATGLLLAERCSLFLHDARNDQLWTRVALDAAEIRVPSAAGIVGLAFKSRAAVNIPSAYDDPRFNREVDRKTGFVTRNLLTLPVLDTDGNPVGVLQVINKHTSGFTGTDEMLAQLLADQAGVAIQRHGLQQRAIDSETLRREMDLAKRVQQALIPLQPPSVPGLRCAGWTRPASQTGGDCYDLWRTHDGRLGLLLADASGHGIAPALVVSQARTLVRALAQDKLDPRILMTRINERLAEDLKEGMFVTAFVAFIDPGGGVEWSSAGHGPVLLRTEAGATLLDLDAAGPPLGVMPYFDYEATTPYRLGPGGLLAVMSDGITEAFSPDNQLFGVERTLPLLAETGETPAERIETIRHAVTLWQENREPRDDQTLVMVEPG